MVGRLPKPLAIQLFNIYPSRWAAMNTEFPSGRVIPWRMALVSKRAIAAQKLSTIGEYNLTSLVGLAGLNSFLRAKISGKINIYA